MEDYLCLFQPMKIGNVTIKNRISVAPMALGFHFDHSTGGFNAAGAEHYIRQARGGFGLIFSASFQSDNVLDPVNESSMQWWKNPLVFRNSAREMNRVINNFGCKMFAQITIGKGRNSPGYYAGSELPVWHNPSVPDPHLTSPELTKEQIKIKIDCFVKCAVAMKEAGFSGIDVHALHSGYLLDELAMSIQNKRTDEYGGCLENRLRLCKEILDAVKAACGKDFPVTMRLGMRSYLKDYQAGKGSVTGKEEQGRTLEEAIEIARLLEKWGYDALSLDVGVYESMYYCQPPMYIKRGFSLEMAAEVKKAVHIPVVLAGRMSDPDIAAEAVSSGKIDGICIGRQSFADPEFPKKLEKGRRDRIRPCIACNQGCIHRFGIEGSIGCAVNPELREMESFFPAKAQIAQNVMIVGGGVAGMEAARTAAKRGHRVSLYEKSDKLGGNLIPASAHDFKEEVGELNIWYQREILSLGVEIHLNEEMTPQKIEALHPDVVILSIGSVPVIPKLPGIDSSKVYSCIDILTGKAEMGDKVIVIGGGMVGCEIALDCINHHKEVTIVETQNDILLPSAAIPTENRTYLIDSFEEYATPILVSHRLKAITDVGVVLESVKDGTEKILEADTIVISVGFKPLPSMAGKLYGKNMDVYEAGDGKTVGNIMTSVWEAYEIARRI